MYLVFTRMPGESYRRRLRIDLRSDVLINCEGLSHKTVSTNHNLFEEKGEPKRNRAEALLLTSPANALPLGQTDSLNE